MAFDINGKTILFQGDSITDAGRDRQDITSLGNGYVQLINNMHKEAYPESDVKFINKGVGGDKSGDLFGRWDSDCIDLKPDLLTIMVGINDTSRNDHDENSDFIKFFKGIVERTLNETDAKIILMEPFVLPVYEERANRRTRLDYKIDYIRKLAVRHRLNLIPLDGIFNSVSTLTGYEHWAQDGVHPTTVGHELIARTWLDELEKVSAE